VKLNFFEKMLGSGFFTGYLPMIPGTWGSLAALLIYLIPGFENPSFMFLMISLFIVIGIPIGDRFESVYGKDPKECTIDEVVGMWITLLFLPRKIWWIIAAFVIWRLMDIVKPFPARQFEKIKGGWGIMLDDITAGLYSFISIQMVIYLYNLFLK
jgi:phosphatidylglycerophosphatase A